MINTKGCTHTHTLNILCGVGMWPELDNMIGTHTHTHSKYLMWCGHVARIGQYDRGRISYRVLLYKNYQYLDSLEAVHGRGRQNHCRLFRDWRWERSVVKYWGRGANWREYAADPQVWQENCQHFVEWKKLIP